MCGPKDTAQRQAQQAEDERRRQIAVATAAIDRAFSGRGGQLADFANALRANFMSEITDQKADADRRLKFALARGGQTGGSLARDSGRQLGEEFQEGLLKGSRRALPAEPPCTGAGRRGHVVVCAKCRCSAATEFGQREGVRFGRGPWRRVQ